MLLTIANAFRQLPFAFLSPEEVEQIALEIEAGKINNALNRLAADIEVHMAADNWTKGKLVNSMRLRILSLEHSLNL